MTQRSRGTVLLLVQLVLVLSIAGKYVYERKMCPRVWVRTAQFDPSLALRGRYLALGLAVDACGLSHDPGNLLGPRSSGIWKWRVKPAVKDGQLVVLPVGYDVRPESTLDVTQQVNDPCDRAA